MEAAKPLFKNVAPLPLPPFLNDRVYDSLAERPQLDPNASRPLPSWTFARKRPSGNNLPQTIAHRGYKASYPENTMGAFKGAIEVGTHAIETDIHLTKDGVVVLSHDATLKRCFGKDEKIIDCNWDYISQQRTTKTPHEQMPRLQDLLEYLSSPGLENIWLLLDIKLDNDTDSVIRLIAEVINSTPPSPHKPWNHRVLLGCWAAKYLPLCAKYLPHYPITHIGFSLAYAHQFFSAPNVSFNILQKTLMAPFFGPRFLASARRENRPVYTWTVNETSLMRWCIQKELDGVITDDPKEFLQVCRRWEDGRRDVHVTWRQWLSVAWINLMVLIFGAIFWWKYGGSENRGKMREGRRIAAKVMVTPARS